jgi:hypothetical protein
MKKRVQDSKTSETNQVKNKNEGTAGFRQMPPAKLGE